MDARLESFGARIRSLNSAQRVLAALILAGIGLRVAATASWWPTIPTFADSWPYAYHAAHAPFGDPQHPAGYSVFLWGIGLVSKQVAVVTILQHLIGIATALLLFAAVRRLVGSPWPALVPAAVVLLNADQVYQEQLVASEPLSAALLVAALYATVRAVDSRAIGWSIIAGLLAAASTIIRTEGMFVAPILALGLLVSHGRPWRRYWRTPTALLCVWSVLLLSYGTVKDLATGHFEVGPSTGWQLYARAATFADCRLFIPPQGTAGLCESTPAPNRFGHDHYMYDPSSPAVRIFGSIGHSDGKLLGWALVAIESQPGAYLSSVYHNLRDYFIPSTFAYVPGAGGGLDGELDWGAPPDLKTQHDVIAGVETFFHPFQVDRHPRRVQALRAYQRVFRFGATLLTLTALATLLGLAIGARRSRVGALLFGVGGLVTLLPGALVGAYLGRYSVPLDGPMAAAASIVVWTLWHMERARRISADPTHIAVNVAPGDASDAPKQLAPGHDERRPTAGRQTISQPPT